MKHAIAWLAFMSIISPALAERSYDQDAYAAAKSQWKADKWAVEDAWKDAGKPDPKPANPPNKPKRSDF